MAKTKHIAVRDLGKVQAHVKRVVSEVQRHQAEDAARWQTLIRLIDEGEVSLIFEGEVGSIDGGLIVTDIGEVTERIDAK